MPHAFLHRHGASDQGPALAVHDLVEPEVVADRARPDHVIVFRVLHPERDPRHLLHDAAHDFEPRRERKIPVAFVAQEEHREMLVREILRQLRDHGFRPHCRRVGGHAVAGKRDFGFDHLPDARLALAGNHADEVGRRLVEGHVAEVEHLLGAARGAGPRQRQRGQPDYRLAHHSECAGVGVARCLYGFQIISATVLPAGMNGSTCSV